MWMYILMNVYLHSLYEISTLRLVRLKGEPFERSENQSPSLGIDTWDLSEAKIKDTLPLSNPGIRFLVEFTSFKKFKFLENL